MVTLFFACAFLLGSLPNSVVVFTLCVGYLVVYCGLVVVCGYLWWWVLVVCLGLVAWLLSVRFWAWFVLIVFIYLVNSVGCAILCRLFMVAACWFCCLELFDGFAVLVTSGGFSFDRWLVVLPMVGYACV